MTIENKIEQTKVDACYKCKSFKRHYGWSESDVGLYNAVKKARHNNGEKVFNLIPDICPKCEADEAVIKAYANCPMLKEEKLL